MAGRQTISDVFDLYDRALTQTRSRLERRVVEGTKALDTFYTEFLRDQVVRFEENFQLEAFRREMHHELQQRHRSTTLRFWAIDGACETIETSDLAVFYGGAYVVKGELGLQENPPVLSYRESEPEDDSSLVAYLPLSPEDITMIDPEDRFVVSDSERITTSGLDTSLMLLAEVFLCYRGASSVDRPHLILWDHSLSSVLANATPNVRRLRLSGVQISGETVWYPDLLVGYSKPWNSVLDVPTRKAHRLWERMIAKIYESPSHSIELNQFANDARLPLEIATRQCKLLWECDRYGVQHEGSNPPDALLQKDKSLVKLNPDYANSPAKIERMYLQFCNQLFRDKDPSCLLYSYNDSNGNLRQRFLSSEELSFLLAIGLRLTFEFCWKHGVTLIGVVKDSGSAYFTNHYLGVLRHVGRFAFTPRLIPITDRLTFERLPYIDDTLAAPWGSPEFDSVFMTLRMRRDSPGSRPSLQGVRGDVLVQPNLVMRSIVQFHLLREPPMDLMMGHAIFIDRLVEPAHLPPERINIVTGDPDLGTLDPFFVPNGERRNREQELAVYLLSVVTRNVFPEVIGYPDPLHYADRGAKAVLRMVDPMLRSSERINRSDPIHRTIRQARGG